MTLTLDNVRVTAPDQPNRRLLNDVSYTLCEGSITLLIGRTGSGKSTLLQVMAGVLEPSAGQVLLDGRRIWTGGRADRTAILRTGLTFQFPEQQLFARSIRHELAYSMRPYRLEPAERKRRIRSVGGILRPTEAYDPERSPFALSGGEQRRLALATTFAASGNWLMMDEPTAGVEPGAVRDLIAYIQTRKEAGAGIVIATHDLDTIFPIADRVLVLDGGSIAADADPGRLCREPEALLQAGVGLPGSVEAALALTKAGLPIPADRFTPEAAAEAIEAAIRSRFNQEPIPESGLAETAPSRCDAIAVHEENAPRAIHATIELEPPKPFWNTLDPRATWAVYLLLVTGAMLQLQWGGIALSAVFALMAFIGLPRIAIRGGLKFLRPFLYFSAVSVALAGLDWSAMFEGGAVAFTGDQALATGMNMSRLFVVTAISYWLAVVNPHAKSVQGLNWALRHGKKLKLPVESFTLAVSMLFRFMPIILREWQRFSVIVRARGKIALRPGKVRVRDVPAMLVPLLLSLFHRAEAMTTALELKAMHGGSLSPLSTQDLSWIRRDSVVLAAGIAGFAVLLLLHLIG